jgi:hypothetical protein
VSETQKLHNESKAEFNGTGSTVDAEVHIAKPNVGQLYRENKNLVAVGVVAFVSGIILKDKLVGVVAKSAHKTAEVAEEVAS